MRLGEGVQQVEEGSSCTLATTQVGAQGRRVNGLLRGTGRGAAEREEATRRSAQLVTLRRESVSSVPFHTAYMYRSAITHTAMILVWRGLHMHSHEQAALSSDGAVTASATATVSSSAAKLKWVANNALMGSGMSGGGGVKAMCMVALGSGLRTGLDGVVLAAIT